MHSVQIVSMGCKESDHIACKSLANIKLNEGTLHNNRIECAEDILRPLQYIQLRTLDIDLQEGRGGNPVASNDFVKPCRAYRHRLDLGGPPKLFQLPGAHGT